jgi:hypothetical protein
MSSLICRGRLPATFAPTAHGAVHLSCPTLPCSTLRCPRCAAYSALPALSQVENTGIEPVTSCLQSRRSPN